MQPRPSFLDYLRQLKEKGQTHLYLDADARGVLRRLFKEVNLLTKKGNPTVTVATPKAAEVRPPAPVIEAKVTSPQSGTAQEKLAALQKQVAYWPPARALGSLREKVVFSAGNAEADLCLIDAAPGFLDEQAGAPLAGPAGEKLDGVLKAMGVSRDETYLTLALKFRPENKKSATANRPATAAELTSCLPFLKEELAIVKPKCLVALGPSAARALLQTDESFESLRGRWHDYEGVPLRVTWHPSFLLHEADDRADKRAVWEDMLAVMEKLELPISERQRGYFLPKR